MMLGSVLKPTDQCFMKISSNELSLNSSVKGKVKLTACNMPLVVRAGYESSFAVEFLATCLFNLNQKNSLATKYIINLPLFLLRLTDYWLCNPFKSPDCLRY